LVGKGWLEGEWGWWGGRIGLREQLQGAWTSRVELVIWEKGSVGKKAQGNEEAVKGLYYSVG